MATTDTDEAMAELGWVRLPKDADGEYIHVGDEMETLISPFEGEHCAVEYLTLLADGWEVDGEPPTSMRHYRKPTVEEVLRDYASRILMAGCIDEEDELVDEYAAKLQLREEA